MSQKLYRPDVAMQFLPFVEEMRIVSEMRRVFLELKEDGETDADAFYEAYLETHRNNGRTYARLGSIQFINSMIIFVGKAIELVEQVIHDRFRPLRDQLALHSAIANCLDPIRLFELATTPLAGGASLLERRRHFEARRSMAIAMQLFVIEKYDPEIWVVQDLDCIEKLSWQRLFSKGRSERIWIASQSWEGVIRKIYLAQSKRRLNRFKKRFDHAHDTPKIKFLECRIAEVGQEEFLIYVVDRRKRLFPTLLKLERGRSVLDRRGWKYVVVGVRNRNRIRLAVREDAEKFSRHTRDVLWKDPLIAELDASPPNPNRDPNYWDCKTIGRFSCPRDERVVAGGAEQLVTTLGDQLEDQFATSGRNHELYRHQQVLDNIGPKWFPSTREFLVGLPNVMLPGYGVNWRARETSEALHAWWQSQL